MSSIGNKDVFAKNLTRYLDRFGKSQREMAEIIGVSPSTFNDWAKGRKYPRIDKIEMLANYFGILKSDLIEEVSNESQSPSEPQLTGVDKELFELLKRIPEDKKRMFLQLGRVFEENLNKE